MRHLRRRLAAAAALVALAVPLGHGTAGAASTHPPTPGRPVVIAADANGTVTTLTGRGEAVARLTDIPGQPMGYDLSRGIAAVSAMSGTFESGYRFTLVAVDARTGRQLFTVPDAGDPIVLRDGRVAFLPDRAGRRDRYQNSLWMRERSGHIRRLVAFEQPGGIRTTLGAEGAMIGVSFDKAGRSAAISFGNDGHLFDYDVWVLDVLTRQARRLTDDWRHRRPAMSDDGRRIAAQHEGARCDNEWVFRVSDLVVLDAATGASRRLTAADCSTSYFDPTWVSAHEIAAMRHRVIGGHGVSDAVVVDVRTARIRVLAAATDVTRVSASRSVGRVLVARASESGYHLVDPRTGADTYIARADQRPYLAGTRSWG